MDNKIFCLIGMVASGKSTYCKNAARQGAITLNDDAVVKMVHGDDYTLYDESFKIFYKSIENYVLSTALAMGRTVVVDRGLNIAVQGRQRWVSLARSFDVDCEAIVFPHDGVETHARRRTDHDSRGHDYNYWHSVAQAHDKRYSVPKIEEGFTAVHHISFEEIIAGKVIQ